MRTEDRLRAAERAQDPVALLRARLRAGQVDRRLVALAAYCGDEVARVVVPVESFAHLFDGDWDVWLAGGSPDGLPMDRWAATLPSLLDGHPRAHWLLVAMGLAVAHEVWTTAYVPDEERTWGALQAVQAWLDCPCEEHADAVKAVMPVAMGSVYCPPETYWWSYLASAVFARTWAVSPGPKPVGVVGALLDAARLLPPDQVRAACLRAVQRELDRPD